MVKQAGSSQPKRTMARSSRASASKSPPKVNGHSSSDGKLTMLLIEYATISIMINCL